MSPDGVAPERPLAGPLDDDTAERLVAGRVGPDDAPPGYAGVAGVLQAAAGPADPEELVGEEAVLAMFRAHGSAVEPGRPGVRERAHRGGGARTRAVALALAGVMAAGGLWMADGAPTVPGRRSPTRGVGAEAAGSGAPGSVRQVRPTTPPVTAPGPEGRATTGPSAGERPTARHGGGAGTVGGPAKGAKPARPGKKPKPTPNKGGAKPKPGPEPNGGPSPGSQHRN